MSVILTDDLCASRSDGARRTLRAHLKVRLPLADLPRLAEAVEGGGEIDVDLHISRSADGVPLVAGQVTASVSRDCQRCLDRVDQTLEIELCVGIAAPGTKPDLPDGYEACEAESLTLGDLVQDEVLLALPMIALHDDRKQCGPLAGKVEQSEHESESDSSRHPFVVLASLKTN